MKLLNYCILLLIIFCLNGCFQREFYHGAKVDQSLIKIGDSIDHAIKALGQESFIANEGKSVYYISSDAKQLYFLRPSTIEYKIIKVIFENQKVYKIEHLNHRSKYYNNLAFKLKNQDGIKAEDFFKEVVGTSTFNPAAK
jgi:hypothetical protein